VNLLSPCPLSNYLVGSYLLGLLHVLSYNSESWALALSGPGISLLVDQTGIDVIKFLMFPKVSIRAVIAIVRDRQTSI
jgi:hypothetical protein